MARIIWKYGKPLSDVKFIENIEKELNVKLPSAYVEIVTQHDNSRPNLDCFKAEKGREYVFGYFFTLKNDDFLRCCKSFMTDCGFPNFMPFADTPNGDDICFDIRDWSIVYVNHETNEIEKVAPSFSDFLEMLYLPE